MYKHIVVNIHAADIVCVCLGSCNLFWTRPVFTARPGHGCKEWFTGLTCDECIIREWQWTLSKQIYLALPWGSSFFTKLWPSHWRGKKVFTSVESSGMIWETHCHSDMAYLFSSSQGYFQCCWPQTLRTRSNSRSVGRTMKLFLLKAKKHDTYTAKTRFFEDLQSPFQCNHPYLPNAHLPAHTCWLLDMWQVVSTQWVAFCTSAFWCEPGSWHTQNYGFQKVSGI